MSAWQSNNSGWTVGLLLLLTPALAKEFLPLTIPSGLVEDYSVCRWSMEDGLPDNEVRSFCFTSDGFLWCLAGEHVVRFDGLACVPLELPTGLPRDNDWQGVAADQTGSLWLYGRGGAYHWSGTNWLEVFKSPVIWMQGGTSEVWATSTHALWTQNRLGEKSFLLPTSETIQAVALDTSQHIWLATDAHVWRFAQGEFQQETLPPECALRHVAQLAVGRDGTVWMASSEALCCKRQGHWERVPVPETLNGRRLDITSLYAADDGVLWVGTERNLYHMRYGLWPEVLQNEQSPIRAVHCLNAAPDGRLWLGTGNGLLQLRRRYIRTYLTEEPLHNETITALAVDAAGNVVAGVADAGLYQVRPAGDLTPSPQQGLPDRIWIAALTFGHDGTLWVGTRGDGLWRCRNNQAEQISAEPAALNINALLEEPSGRLLVGTDKGLHFYDEHRHALAPILDTEGRTYARRVNTLLEDRTGRLWVGTQNDGLLLHATHTIWRQSPVVSGPILALQQNNAGLLWAGTPAGLKSASSSFLDGECVAQLLQDNTEHFWLGLRHDLLRVSAQQLQVWNKGQAVPSDLRRFGGNEGLPAAPCASGTGHLMTKSPDGRLWFATQHGLAMVDPWKIPELPTANLRVFLQDVQAEGSRGFEFETWKLGPPSDRVVRLPAGSRNVTFHFTAPYYDEPEAVHFCWGLRGFDSGNNMEPNPERKAVYPHLPPGTYQFWVRADVNGGPWSQRMAGVTLVVAPFFWQTWWWHALGLCAGMGSVMLAAMGVYRWRLHRHLQVEQLRLRIARDLHDEIGANLGGIALLLGTTDQAQGAEIWQRIRAITLQSIATLQELVWMIDPVHDSLADLIERMRDIAENLLPNIAHEFNVTGEPSHRLAPLELRRNILPIFKEALHNIIKHAQAQHVAITLTVTSDQLWLSVYDDGVGLNPAVQTHGHGLRYMQRRATELGGQLQIASQPGQGLTLSLHIPLKRGSARKIEP